MSRKNAILAASAVTILGIASIGSAFAMKDSDPSTSSGLSSGYGMNKMSDMGDSVKKCGMSEGGCPVINGVKSLLNSTVSDADKKMIEEKLTSMKSELEVIMKNTALSNEDKILAISNKKDEMLAFVTPYIDAGKLEEVKKKIESMKSKVENGGGMMRQFSRGEGSEQKDGDMGNRGNSGNMMQKGPMNNQKIGLMRKGDIKKIEAKLEGKTDAEQLAILTTYLNRTNEAIAKATGNRLPVLNGLKTILEEKIAELSDPSTSIDDILK